MTGGDWAVCCEQLQSCRFGLLRSLIALRVQRLCLLSASLSPAFNLCLEALDSATAAYLPIVYDCLRALLPLASPELGAAAGDFSLHSALPELLSTAFSAFQQSRRDDGTGLAFFSLIFHPALFAEPALHSSPSALCCRSIASLLPYAAQHSRFAFLLAAFASILFPAHPSIAVQYAAVIAFLCCYHHDDSRQEADELQDALAAHQLCHLTHSCKPASQQERELLTDRTLAGKAQTMTRLLTLLWLERCITQGTEQVKRGHQVDAEVQRLLSAVLSELLRYRLLQPEAAEAASGSVLFVEKVAALQAVCVLTRALPLLPVDSGSRLRAELLSLVWRSLEQSNSTVIRHLLEVCLSCLCIQQPGIVRGELLPRFSLYSSRPTLQASLVVVLGFACLHCSSESERPQLLSDAMSALLPLLSSNYGHTRLVAQFFFVSVAQLALPPPAVASVLSADSALQRLLVSLRDDADLAKLRERQAAYFSSFDPVERCTVRGLLADCASHRSLVPAPLLHRTEHLVTDFLSQLHSAYDDFYDQVRGQQATTLQPLHNARSQADTAAVATERRGSEVDAQAAGRAGRGGGDGEREAADANWQEKWGLKELSVVDELYAEAVGAAEDEDGAEDAEDALAAVSGWLEEQDEDEDEEARRTAARRQPQSARPGPSLPAHRPASSGRSRLPLIVCGSLLTRAPNLAALARTAEIFQCAELTVPNAASLLADPLFLRISVSSQRWLPIQELGPQDVAARMRQWQTDGFTVVALEQSRDSVLLTEFSWPERCVLLLGSEREGVPVELLNAADCCVQIPQGGVLRSFNVHAAAVIALWEYWREVGQRYRAAASRDLVATPGALLAAVPAELKG